jgi:U3 small nucleolar RNA-associated protein 18
MAPTGLKVKEKLNHKVAGEGSIGEGSFSDGVLAKDETEERLEKLLFGDDAGFIEGLKARPADGQLTSSTIRSDRGGAGDAELEGDEEDLESIADENVRCQLRVL